MISKGRSTSPSMVSDHPSAFDPGDHQRGVDPVELLVRGPEGGIPRTVARGPPAGRRAVRPRRAGSPSTATRPRQHLPDAATGGGEGPQPGGRGEHGAAPLTGRPASGRVGPRARRGVAVAAPQRSSRPRNQLAARDPGGRRGEPGRRSTAMAVGRSAAAQALRPAPGRRAGPARGCGACGPRARFRRRASSVARATEPTRIGLSAVPKVATAHSLTGVGVASMTVDPTARTGEDSGDTRPATR